jgi:hypothetical protein
MSDTPRASEEERLDETLVELIEEIADWIRQSRGPSLFMGEYAIEQSVREVFRQRLLDAVLSDVPDADLTEYDIQAFEVGRKAYLREKQALALRDEGIARHHGMTLEEYRRGDHD